MIIQEAAIDSHWYRASGGWFITFFMTSCLAFPTFDEMGYDINLLWPLLWIGFGGSAILYVIGKFRPKTPTRVLEFVIVFGAFGMLPLLVGVALCTLSYFILIPDVTVLVWTVRILFVVTSIAWVWREFSAFRICLVERRFIENEFRVEEDRITISRRPRTSIDRPQIGDTTMIGRLFNKLVPRLLLPLLLFGYPLQRLLMDAGGIEMLLLFVFAILLPFSINSFSQMTCATYLWVFKVWQMERRHGKPVVFKEKD